MATPLSLREAMSLLRSIEKESLPIEVVGKGHDEQAVFLVGFVSIDNDQGVFSVYTTGLIGMTIILRGARMEYAEPREAPRQHRERVERLLRCMIRIVKDEWELVLRVRNKPT